MKLHLTLTEFEDAILSAINLHGVFPGRRVTSVTIPDKYSSLNEVVIMFAPAAEVTPIQTEAA